MTEKPHIKGSSSSEPQPLACAGEGWPAFPLHNQLKLQCPPRISRPSAVLFISTTYCFNLSPGSLIYWADMSTRRRNGWMRLWGLTKYIDAQSIYFESTKICKSVVYPLRCLDNACFCRASHANVTGEVDLLPWTEVEQAQLQARPAGLCECLCVNIDKTGKL